MGFLLLVPFVFAAIAGGYFVWVAHEEKKANAERRKTFDRIMQASKGDVR